jgi:hypothetical protein
MWAAKAIAKKKIPLDNTIINKGEKITITRGKEYEYAIWHSAGIFDLPKEYVKDIKVICAE